MLRFLKKLFGSAPKADLRALVQDGAVLVDVRSPGEYKGGHVKGAVNYPLNELKQHIGELKSKQKPVITMCRSGARSGVASSMLKDNGITAYNGGPWTKVASLLQQ